MNTDEELSQTLAHLAFFDTNFPSEKFLIIDNEVQMDGYLMLYAQPPIAKGSYIGRKKMHCPHKYDSDSQFMTYHRWESETPGWGNKLKLNESKRH